VSIARLIRRLLTLTAIVEIVAALLALLFGGFYFTVGSLPISARGPYKPFVIGVTAACLAIWLYELETRRTTSGALQSSSRAIAATAAVATLAIGIHFGAFAAGGADSYGYVSQALLWAEGRLVVKEPLAALHPLLAPAAVPLGYQLTGSDTSVSIYPPGLPVLMAAAFRIGGEYALYLVVPLLGALTVWLTYVLGRRVGDWRTGLLASVAVSCSPIFVLQLLMPMSDVPSAALWLAALVVSLSNISGAAFLAGLIGSLAVLTRPDMERPVKSARSSNRFESSIEGGRGGYRDG
jgi:Dolichyl-phosphate-mannose-protein mannosyltransferase